jgi:hypothetical protein
MWISGRAILSALDVPPAFWRAKNLLFAASAKNLLLPGGRK